MGRRLAKFQGLSTPANNFWIKYQTTAKWRAAGFLNRGDLSGAQIKKQLAKSLSTFHKLCSYAFRSKKQFFRSKIQNYRSENHRCRSGNIVFRSQKFMTDRKLVLLYIQPEILSLFTGKKKPLLFSG